MTYRYTQVDYEYLSFMHTCIIIHVGHLVDVGEELKLGTNLHGSIGVQLTEVSSPRRGGERGES